MPEMCSIALVHQKSRSHNVYMHEARALFKGRHPMELLERSAELCQHVRMLCLHAFWHKHLWQ